MQELRHGYVCFVHISVCIAVRSIVILYMLNLANKLHSVLYACRTCSYSFLYQPQHQHTWTLCCSDLMTLFIDIIWIMPNILLVHAHVIHFDNNCIIVGGNNNCGMVTARMQTQGVSKSCAFVTSQLPSWYNKCSPLLTLATNSSNFCLAPHPKGTKSDPPHFVYP